MPTVKPQIVEVAPRDGLQAEATHLSTDLKVALIERLIAAGARRIEIASFVNPKRVPQMADAEALIAALPKSRDVSFIGLVLNRRGFERAAKAGVSEVNFGVVASDTFSQRNQGSSTENAIAVWADIARAAYAAKVDCSVVIGAAFGCPFEGEVPVKRVVDIARRVAEHGPTEIALADTIGVASPGDVVERFRAVSTAIPDVPLRGHFHNTRNTGLANAYAAVECGVSALDASLGGIGGCPFAPKATGNIPTEDLVYMLARMKIDTGMSLPALIKASSWLEQHLGRPVPAMLGKAGVFPPERVAIH
jgi:hydroxymethylglutaryl-CoA lyase